MRIASVSCDSCGYSGRYPDALSAHEHRELEIGGVPTNIWTPVYYAPARAGSLKDGDGYRGLVGAALLDGISMGEGNTPLVPVNGLGGKEGIFVHLKREGDNPTGSFKDRGMPYLVSDAVARGGGEVAIPSTGNAAISLAAYARRAGIRSTVFVPEGTERCKLDSLSADRVVFRPDLIAAYEDFFSFCRENPQVYNGFPAANIPYLEGLKTAAYEIFDSLGGRAPDWLIIPCGSGGNVVALARGFQDIVETGLADRVPKIVPVQIVGADPITQGFLSGRRENAIVIDPMAYSKADAIASDTCFNYSKIMRIIEGSGGTPVSVTDEEIGREIGAGAEDMEFSSIAAYAAGRKVVENLAKPGETLVLIGTGRARG